MRHLVVGGGGFIGSHLVRALLADGEEVAIIDRSPAPARSGGWRWKVHDFAHGPLAADAVGVHDVLYYLIGTYRGSESEMLAVNVAAANDCLASLPRPPGLVIALGAGSGYGETRAPVTEEQLPAPTTFYGLTKWLGELVVTYHARLLGFPYVILRPTNIYGPGNRKNVFAAFYRTYRDKGAVTIYGDGRQERDLVYIDDFLDLLKRLADPSLRTAVSNQVFNVAGVESKTLLDILGAMSEALGEDIPAVHEAAEQGVLTTLRMNCEKVARVTGWRPRVSFADGVRATVSSYVAGGSGS